MSSVVISGDTSGAVTVAAPAVAGSNTLTLQAATATNAVNTLSTAVASTSGTSIDFTGLPSWCKRVTVMFQGVSTNNTTNHIIQLGTGGTPTYTTSGYLGTCSNVAVASASSTQMSTGFMISNNSSAAATYHGNIVLTLINQSTNAWSEIGSLGRSDNSLGYFSAGSIALSGALTAIRITTVGSADTFDAGSINLLLEG